MRIMLPDYPLIKEKLMRKLNEYMAIKVKESTGFLSEIPSFSIHEGNRWRLGNDTTAESNFEELTGEIPIKFDDAKDMTLASTIAIIDKAAQDIAEQQQRMFFRDISESAQKGKIKSDKGPEPFSKELFLKGLDSIDMSFDKSGNLIPPMLILPPEIWEANKDEVKQWEHDEAFKKKHEELIERKREAWLAREATRKLVD